MNKKEAIIEMVQNGKKVKRKDWLDGLYLHFIHRCFFNHNYVRKDINDYHDLEWELLEEPKKVKMWLWAYKDSQMKKMMQTTFFYASKKNVLAAFNDDDYITHITPILGTEIEVEL